jgi:L-alanine-DL-glutamate epimerase-like enolase superfamily enzyme
MGILVEVGSGDIEKDGRRIERFREELGEDGWLGVTAGGRFDLATALAMAHFLEEDVGIDWFEHPLPVEDRKGYVRLAERMEVPLALGATFATIDEFRQLLEIGDVRVLRPDVLRLGGITPFLKLAALAEAFPITLVPYRLPEIGVHVACALPNVQAVDHVGWLSSLFTEPLRIEAGRLVPPNRPGLGLEFAAK